MALPDNLKAVYTQSLTEREEREASRYSRPIVRLWDAQWILAGTVKDYLTLSCTLKINDIGTASLSLRPDDHLAQWIMDTVDGDTGRSVFLLSIRMVSAGLDAWTPTLSTAKRASSRPCSMMTWSS